jgi:hypothetical protein
MEDNREKGNETKGRMHGVVVPLIKEGTISAPGVQFVLDLDRLCPIAICTI